MKKLDSSVKHWNDTEGATAVIKEPVSATFMTPFFFLDPSSQGTGMTGEGSTGIGMEKAICVMPMSDRKSYNKSLIAKI
ncbi:hypothetical protein [Wolbachia endosymbiont (group A) of Icerya purchasi]|uniref:hypothetical protein n=1 Tax=Wolbachia endosymbiont (group A) of Icerya purchasi TaxID=2954019 RepID=UPI00222F0EE2|nr:hypothetical protein [Wolbachia endosymbiont (group A) of Icerya purchasi]